MRKVLVLGIALVMGLTVGPLATATGGQHAQSCPLAPTEPGTCGPRLEFKLGITVDPKKLPRHQMEPVALDFRGVARNSDGSHPSALREAVVDFDKDIVIDAAGLASCKGNLLRARDTQAARRVCRDSIVGKGIAHVAVASVAEPIRVPLTLFNGGVKEGERRLFIHSFIDKPTRARIVAVVKIQKKGGGLHTVAKIPPIAGGSASLLDFEFKIKRIFGYEGEKKSYLKASCPDHVFLVKTPKILFKNETQASGVASRTVLKGDMAVPCNAQP
jgi:hypothetical protein